MKELQNVQKDLKAPKSQHNSFGNYNYRSAEDILEAVKPLLVANDLTLTLSDDIVEVGGRVYVKATAKVTNGNESVSVTAFAREAETKKGMDDSQITGTASSYARKYALNGLFLIDDTKDADTDQYKYQMNEGRYTHQNRSTEEEYEYPATPISERSAKDIKTLLEQTGANVPAFLEYYGVKSVEEMTTTQYADAVMRLSKKDKKSIEVK